MIYIALESFESCAMQVEKGDRLIRYFGPTYGCISPFGIAVVRREGDPFFEVPLDKVEKLESGKGAR